MEVDSVVAATLPMVQAAPTAIASSSDAVSAPMKASTAAPMFTPADTVRLHPQSTTALPEAAQLFGARQGIPFISEAALEQHYQHVSVPSAQLRADLHVTMDQDVRQIHAHFAAERERLHTRLAPASRGGSRPPRPACSAR